MRIIRFDGIDKRLYELVAPVVMNPAVLRQNNNYPFKTSFRYVWYVAVEDGDAVVGFMPLKPSSDGVCIDNYYIRDDDGTTAGLLLGDVVAGCADSGVLTALVHKRHVGLFRRNGFVTVRQLKNYDKMKYSPGSDD